LHEGIQVGKLPPALLQNENLAAAARPNCSTGRRSAVFTDGHAEGKKKAN